MATRAYSACLRGQLSSNVRPHEPTTPGNECSVKLEAVRIAALALPETTEEPHHHFGSFRVRGKIFITVPPDNEHIHVFVNEQDREIALAAYPEFTEKLLWGSKVVGVRVALPKAKTSVVHALVRKAYEHKSAKFSARATAKRPASKPRRESAA